ncbi:MAG: type I pullulanase, partial [Erysipelotrichaceae bacterium]|nr:type I pullulanase [Erysipelotrichaceae bacterium]
MRKYDMMEAYLDDYGRITAYVHEQFYQGKSDHFYLKDSTGTVIACSIMSVSRSDNSYTKYSLDAPKTIQIGKEYFVVADYALMCPLKFGYIVRTERFDKEFYYDGDDLGIHYEPKQTSFVLWAPIAIEVLVDMTSQGNRMIIPMKRTEKGVFRAVVPGNHDGARYVYRVNVNGRWNQAIDPYGQSACANKLAGFVINPQKTEMNMHDDCLPPFTSYTDAILYETHVRDFSKQCQTPYAGLFLGMIQKGLKTPNGNPAGFDYVKQLGITHLQLQPVADFTTVDENNPNGYYNWGYDPGHYNIPEGSYSTDPDDPYARITEFKQLVSAYHEAGIRIVMDVVYNHMHSLRNNDFEQIVP